jgi:hypothetical protein
LESQFQVDLDVDDILWPAFEELPTIYIYAGIDIILSPPVRDILLNLASSALYDALMYMGSRAQRAELATKTETKFRISLKDENERPIYEVDGSTNDPEIVKQLLQQVSDVARQALDD